MRRAINFDQQVNVVNVEVIAFVVSEYLYLHALVPKFWTREQVVDKLGHFRKLADRVE